MGFMFHEKLILTNEEKKTLRCARTVGVLANGDKVLDDLAAYGYVAAELADWVGPTSAEVAQGS